MRLAPTERFSSRVQNYVRFRPRYPDAVLDLLRSQCGLTPDSIVADIGSGTGISTELLLRSGATVYAIEPNADMRQAAENQLGGETNFHSLSATAEATGLPDQSIDLIVAGQAFHWFDTNKAREEFQRILRPRGWVALMWNDRITQTTEFVEGYEQILRDYMPEYMQVGHKDFDETCLAQFFGGQMNVAHYPNGQSFDFDALLGRVLSSSYAPEPGTPQYEPMRSAMEALFTRTQRDGKVDFLYDTQVFYGHLNYGEAV